MDWGLFHTNPHFFSHWKAFHKLLVQRNAALKARAPRNELLIWNHAFAIAGEELNAMRKNYLTDFIPVFNRIIATFLPNVQISINYSQGWDENVSLETCLNQNASRETFAGHGLFGPHRSDLNLYVSELSCHDALSQGQQKLVSYALRLAQGLHLQSSTRKVPVYLIDDLPSELDSQSRSLVTNILANLNAQVFITGIDHLDLVELLELNDQNLMFHVKHGMILGHIPQNCFT